MELLLIASDAGYTDIAAEKPTRKAIENRVFKLRKEALASLKSTGVYDPEPVTNAGDAGNAETGETRRTKRPRLMPTPPPQPSRGGRAGRDPGVTRNNLDVAFGAPVLRGQEDEDEDEVEAEVKEEVPETRGEENDLYD